MVELSEGYEGRAAEIAELFTATFAASEGAAEGATIGALARNLLDTTPEEDLHVFCAADGPALVGCIVFSRLRYEQDPRAVFLLSPVAVATERQGTGIGQRLLTYGLDDLRRRGVEVAVTYGDPKYYAKVGFQPITEDVAQAPLPMTYPHGWLAQSLASEALAPIPGPSKCAAALDDPAYW